MDPGAGIHVLGPGNGFHGAIPPDTRHDPIAGIVTAATAPLQFLTAKQFLRTAPVNLILER